MRGREIVVEGSVVEEVTEEEEHSHYRIKTKRKEYDVVSNGIQAIKDQIFIRKGQNMVVEGAEKDDVIIARKSKIII